MFFFFNLVVIDSFLFLGNSTWNATSTKKVKEKTDTGIHHSNNKRTSSTLYDNNSKRTKSEPKDKVSSELLHQLISNNHNRGRPKDKSNWLLDSGGQKATCISQPSESVLMNLLVNGFDIRAGYICLTPSRSKVWKRYAKDTTSCWKTSWYRKNVRVYLIGKTRRDLWNCLKCNLNNEGDSVYRLLLKTDCPEKNKMFLLNSYNRRGNSDKSKCYCKYFFFLVNSAKDEKKPKKKNYTKKEDWKKGSYISCHSQTHKIFGTSCIYIYMYTTQTNGTTFQGIFFEHLKEKVLPLLSEYIQIILHRIYF